MSEPKVPPAPNPRLVVWSLVAIFVVQGVYAGFEILGDGVDTSQPVQALAGVAYFVYAVLLAGLAFGAWRRMPWVWHLAVSLAGFGLVLSFLQVLGGDSISGHALGFLIDGGLFVYLLRPNVRAFFDA